MYLHFRTMNEFVRNKLYVDLIRKSLMKLFFFHELRNSSYHCLKYSSSFNFDTFRFLTNQITLHLFSFFWCALISFLLLFLISLRVCLIVQLFFWLVLLRFLRLVCLLKWFVVVFTHLIFDIFILYILILLFYWKIS